MALGAAFGGAPRRDRDERPGHGPQGRDDRPRGDARAADGRHRRAARRPVDRHADEDRAVRPAAWRCYGRHGESPLPVLAASTPGHCFEAVYEAARIAVRYRTPVILLSDLFLANSSEPWRIPDVGVAAARSTRASRTRRAERRAVPARTRATTSGARPWAIPGTPGPRAPHRRPGEAGRHRRHLLRRRQPRDDDAPARGARSRASTVPRRSRSTATRTPSCWCSAGARATATIRAGARRVRDARRAGRDRAPAPPQPAARRTLGEVLRAFERVLVPEMNSGPARADAARRVPGRRRVATRRCRASRCCRRRSERRDRWQRAELTEGGLPVRPGDALVPGLRRLRGPGRRAGLLPGAGDPAGADRVRLRHRLRRALRVLHGHLRDARHPRPRAGAGHRAWRPRATTSRSGS